MVWYCSSNCFGAVRPQLGEGKLQGERVSLQEGQQVLQRDARRARQAVRLQNRSGKFQRVTGGETRQFLVQAGLARGEGGVGDVGVAGGDEECGILMVVECPHDFRRTSS